MVGKYIEVTPISLRIAVYLNAKRNSLYVLAKNMYVVHALET